MGFWSFGSEVATPPLLEALHARGVRVCLPRIEDGDLVAVAYEPGDPLRETSFGAREPAAGTILPPEVLDLVVTPGSPSTGSGTGSVRGRVLTTDSSAARGGACRGSRSPSTSRCSRGSFLPGASTSASTSSSPRPRRSAPRPAATGPRPRRLESRFSRAVQRAHGEGDRVPPDHLEEGRRLLRRSGMVVGHELRRPRGRVPRDPRGVGMWDLIPAQQVGVHRAGRRRGRAARTHRRHRRHDGRTGPLRPVRRRGRAAGG